MLFFTLWAYQSIKDLISNVNSLLTKGVSNTHAMQVMPTLVAKGATGLCRTFASCREHKA